MTLGIVVAAGSVVGQLVGAAHALNIRWAPGAYQALVERWLFAL